MKTPTIKQRPDDDDEGRTLATYRVGCVLTLAALLLDVLVVTGLLWWVGVL